jgi:hypothetical protein
MGIMKYINTLCGQSEEFFNPVVPKVCSADPKGSATRPQGICKYISVMATLKFTYLLHYRNNFC